MSANEIVHVGSINIEDEVFSPVRLEITSTGSLYNFSINPVTERGVELLKQKSGQDFALYTPYEVGSGDCGRSQDIPGIVRYVLGDIRENYGLNFSFEDASKAIKEKEVERRRDSMHVAPSPGRT